MSLKVLASVLAAAGRAVQFQGVILNEFAITALNEHVAVLDAPEVLGKIPFGCILLDF